MSTEQSTCLADAPQLEPIRKAYAAAVEVYWVQVNGRWVELERGPVPQTPENVASQNAWIDRLLAEADKFGVDLRGDDWEEQMAEFAKRLPKERHQEFWGETPVCPNCDEGRADG
jgi:hypothetical protein